MRAMACAFLAALAACSPEAAPKPSENPMSQTPNDAPAGEVKNDVRGDSKGSPTDEELKKKLTAEQYYICRMKGTERPFANKYWDFKGEGKYHCVACGSELFESKTKYDSKSGWPSFWEPSNKDRVKTKVDTDHGMVRTEVMCAKCDSHLGHVFDDGPQPTGMRYCINSAALEFKGVGEPKK